MKTHETGSHPQIAAPPDLSQISFEQLEFRRDILENRLPRISETEGRELAQLYAWFRLRK